MFFRVNGWALRAIAMRVDIPSGVDSASPVDATLLTALRAFTALPVYATLFTPSAV